MAIQHIIAHGIGFQSDGPRWLPTHGFGFASDATDTREMFVTTKWPTPQFVQTKRTITAQLSTTQKLTQELP